MMGMNLSKRTQGSNRQRFRRPSRAAAALALLGLLAAAGVTAGPADAFKPTAEFGRRASALKDDGCCADKDRASNANHFGHSRNLGGGGNALGELTLRDRTKPLRGSSSYAPSGSP